jgi:FkbM family methyltransferase
MIKQAIQKIGLTTNALLVRSGVMRLPFARRAFVYAYTWYKERIEAGPVEALRKFIPGGTLVIDVGANIGFFTTRFADWTGPQGHVVAIEPDLENFGSLEQRLRQHGSIGRTTRLNAVAASQPGSLFLKRNEVHPGDHKIATDGEGIKVAAVAIDDIVAEHASRDVSMIKIDVQGAEMVVLAGARKVLQERSAALFIEVDEKALTAFGTSSHALFAHLQSFGYSGYELGEDGSLTPFETSALRTRLAEGGYVDVLFLKQDVGRRSLAS